MGEVSTISLALRLCAEVILAAREERAKPKLKLASFVTLSILTH
jgi:hypothetical protein